MRSCFRQSEAKNESYLCVLTPQLLRFLEVPQDLYAMTAAYLRITFLGAPFPFCYNALGVNAIAAFNAVTRVDDFACIPKQSISSAISTYIAQNRGAKRKPDPRRFSYRYYSGNLLLGSDLHACMVAAQSSGQLVHLRGGRCRGNTAGL